MILLGKSADGKVERDFESLANSVMDLWFISFRLC